LDLTRTFVRAQALFVSLNIQLTIQFFNKKVQGNNMARNEYTSKKAASAASKVLRNPHSSKAAKTAAASALTQVRDHKKR
jgi:regulatory protein YycI of two-component signal transduction system YycFG